MSDQHDGDAGTVADSVRLQARLIRTDAAEWTALLASVPHDIYQLPAYADVAAWHEGGEPLAAFVEDGRDRRLLVPLILRQVDGTLRDAVSPYGYPGVLTDRPGDAAFAAEAMRAVATMLAEQGVVTLFLRLHPLLGVAGLESVGTIVWRETVAIDLSRSPEQLWADMRKNHQRDIAKSLRDGSEISFALTPDRWEGFVRLYSEAMDRMRASHYYRFDAAYFQRLLEGLGEQVRLVTVLVDHDIAAAAVFTECGGIVEVHLAAADDLYAARRPTKVLIHAICTWAKERGDDWVHLGGGRGSADDSLLHFKAGFSSGRARFGTLRAVLLQDAYRELVAARVPGADPADLGGYFPCYRESNGIASTPS